MITPIIIINPYRLQRNMVAGALVGGTTGVIVGDSEDKKMKKQATSTSGDKALITKIGDKNYTGLKLLISCKHNEAYHMTLATSKSSNLDYQLAAYILQALIDRDRNNITGMTNSLNNFIKIDNEISSMNIAQIELDKLYIKLQDISCP